MDVSHGSRGLQHLPPIDNDDPREVAALTGALGLAPKPPQDNNNKSKRDEWSEGGVQSLLEVYESKWLLRNRAKLKGIDWEDIARQVSIRCSGTKAAKTPNQCKNKIESMKKRYRAESACLPNSSSSSSWQFYGQMDGLLKGTTICSSQPPKLGNNNNNFQILPPKVEMDLEMDGNILHDSNQDDDDDDDGSNTLPNDGVKQCRDNEKKESSRGTDSDLSAPTRSKAGNARDRAAGKDGNPSKRRKSLGSEVAESIRLLAHSMLKIEQVRMDMYKDSERIRAEAEIKRGEMELKRTEIIANTQLQIAKLFSKRSHGRNNTRENSTLKAETGLVARKGD